MGAPVYISRYSISREKGQKENQHHQNCWKGTKKSPRAGSGNEAAERFTTRSPSATHAYTKLIWRVQGPCHEEQETKETESLKPEEAAGEKAAKFPGHNAQERTRAPNRSGLLTGAGQCSDIHATLLLYI
ncbi:hypothetical protein KSB_64360 [Ktedonobacter robiniae]|uniref:Uncharacterized protein n=1 Tax=Ktedonobacter robiniae TaxID=2778365 RepID=A0ABQ3UZ21_9CHLR|nr:hypothetical protein KSB_64360 [Ktedonobacter robiniae]